MAKVYVSIGSNVERRKNIQFGLTELKKIVTDICLSPVYENAAVGFDGEPFYNLVASFVTDFSLIELSSKLRMIEDQAGRDRKQPKFSPRTLDIDILLYDDLIYADDKIQIPRDEIVRYEFVLLPLAKLNPTGIHPQLLKSYEQLWHELSQSVSENNVLKEVDCCFAVKN